MRPRPAAPWLPCMPRADVMDVKVPAPDTIKIIVYEKALTGYVRFMDTYMYFDKDGYVVESSGIKGHVLHALIPVFQREIQGIIAKGTVHDDLLDLVLRVMHVSLHIHLPHRGGMYQDRAVSRIPNGSAVCGAGSGDCRRRSTYTCRTVYVVII